MKQLIQLTERGLIPDFLIRLGIQRLLRERLSELSTENCENRLLLQNRFLHTLGQSDIAELPEKANEQHYEVPSEFFLQVLGPHLKYSCGWWDDSINNLEQSEEAALKKTCETRIYRMVKMYSNSDADGDPSVSGWQNIIRILKSLRSLILRARKHLLTNGLMNGGWRI